jgi:hypothetical protein
MASPPDAKPFGQKKPANPSSPAIVGEVDYLKSLGRRSIRLHFSHSAKFFTLPFSKSVFILISPPHEQKNFCVELVVRLFLLAWAIAPSPCPARRRRTDVIAGLLDRIVAD